MTFAEFRQIQTRRSFLNQSAAGLGAMALGQLLSLEGLTADTNPAKVNPLAPKAPHFAPKAKNVIFLFMAGAPSQMDLFDPKPGLKKWSGQSLPPSMTGDLKLAFIKPTATILPSPREFPKRGEGGIEISDWLPHIGSVADDICLIRSMYSEAFNHHPGQDC